MSQPFKPQGDESRLFKTVERIAIRPEAANAMVSHYKSQVRRAYPLAGEHEIQERVAKKIINRYAKLSATSGGATALAGVIPGLGTAIALVGGGLTDATISMKLQVDMSLCIATAFGWDVTHEEARNLAFLIAAGGSLEKLGVELGGGLGSTPAVDMVRHYLKGAALKAVKGMFNRLGGRFTRKALSKAIPFGVGVVVGSSANYALTQYVGRTAMTWFINDREQGNAPSIGKDP